MSAKQNQIETIQTETAPRAIGTYSQAVRTSNMVYLSGQIPLDPQTMVLVSEDFRAQTEQVFKNLQAVCTAAGGSLQKIVKLTIYVIDLGQFPIVNAVMAQFFQPPYPARATVQVSALPKNAQIECDGVMVIDQRD